MTEISDADVAAMTYYLEKSKRRHFIAFRQLVQKEKKILKRLMSLKEKAEEFYISNLLRRHLDIWKQTTLIPIKEMNAKIKLVRQASLQRTAIRKLYCECVRRKLLECNCKTMVQVKIAAKTAAIFDKWRIHYRKTAFDRNLNGVTTRVNKVLMHEVLQSWIAKQSSINSCEQILQQNNLYGIQQKAFVVLCTTFQTDVQQKAEDQEALAYFKQKSTEQVLKKIIENVQQQLKANDENDLTAFLELKRAEFTRQRSERRLKLLSLTSEKISRQEQLGNDIVMKYQQNTQQIEDTKRAQVSLFETLPVYMQRSNFGATEPIQSKRPQPRTESLMETTGYPLARQHYTNLQQQSAMDKNIPGEMENELIGAYIARFKELKAALAKNKQQQQEINEAMNEYKHRGLEYSVAMQQDQLSEKIDEFDALNAEYEQVRIFLKGIKGE